MRRTIDAGFSTATPASIRRDRRPCRPAANLRSARADLRPEWGARLAFADQSTDQVAIAALGVEINRGRGALLALADFAQIKRLPEPAPGLTDQQYRLIRRLEGKRR